MFFISFNGCNTSCFVLSTKGLLRRSMKPYASWSDTTNQCIELRVHVTSEIHQNRGQNWWHLKSHVRPRLSRLYVVALIKCCIQVLLSDCTCLMIIDTVHKSHVSLDSQNYAQLSRCRKLRVPVPASPRIRNANKYQYQICKHMQ